MQLAFSCTQVIPDIVNSIVDSVSALLGATRGLQTNGCASGILARIDGVVDTEPYLLDLYSCAGRCASAPDPKAATARSLRDDRWDYGF
jgi:hypothetical protein